MRLEQQPSRSRRLYDAGSIDFFDADKLSFETLELLYEFRHDNVHSFEYFCCSVVRNHKQKYSTKYRKQAKRAE